MLKSLVAIGALLAAAPAFAQSTDAALPDPNDQSDTFTIGAGAAYIPDYEGSDDYRIIPAAAIRGRLSGISFFTRATYLYVDVIPRGDGALEFDLGPIAAELIAPIAGTENKTPPPPAADPAPIANASTPVALALVPIAVASMALATDEVPIAIDRREVADEPCPIAIAAWPPDDEPVPMATLNAPEALAPFTPTKTVLAPPHAVASDPVADAPPSAGLAFEPPSVPLISQVC